LRCKLGSRQFGGQFAQCYNFVTPASSKEQGAGSEEREERKARSWEMGEDGADPNGASDALASYWLMVVTPAALDC